MNLDGVFVWETAKLPQHDGIISLIFLPEPTYTSMKVPDARPSARAQPGKKNNSQN